MLTVGPGIWQDNWKCVSWEIHHLGCEIWRGKLKKLENLEMATLGHGIWKKTENHGKWETSTWRHEKLRNYWTT